MMLEIFISTTKMPPSGGVLFYWRVTDCSEKEVIQLEVF